MSSANADRPTLLLVGKGEPMQDALRVALDRHRVDVEACDVDEVSEAVTVSAPDLVLLMGEAAENGGQAVLRTLAEQPATSVVPVALLADDRSLGHRLRAFRSGAVAVIERTPSADAMARRVVEVARELPERPGEARGELGEATLDELVKLVSQELRSGILSVEAEGEDEDAVRVVLGAGGQVALALEDFVHRIRPLIEKAEPLRYEFHEASGGRLGFLGVDGGAGDLSVFSGLRMLIMDNDPGRADILAQALRERQAQVAVTDVSVDGLERGERLDPEVIILDAGAIEGEGFEAVRRIRRNPRLRWASLLVARWDELWMADPGLPDIEKLAGQVAPLTQHDHALRTRAAREKAFDTRLELTGPSRLLRSLARTSGTLHVTVRCSQATLEIDLSDGLLVGAQGTRHGANPQPIEGLTAVAVFMMLGTGRVRVEKRGHPSCANVMTPVDEALSAAGLEVPPLVPSAPPPPLFGGDLDPDDLEPTGEGPTAGRADARGPDSGTHTGLRGPSKPEKHEVLGTSPPAGRSRAGTMLGMAPIGKIQPVKTPPSGSGRRDPRDPDAYAAANDSDHPTQPPQGLAAGDTTFDSYHPTVPPQPLDEPPAEPAPPARPALRVPSPADMGVKVPAPSAVKPKGRTMMGVGALGNAPPKASMPRAAAAVPPKKTSAKAAAVPARPTASGAATPAASKSRSEGRPAAKPTPARVRLPRQPTLPGTAGLPTGSGPEDDDVIDLGSGLLEVPDSLMPPSRGAGPTPRPLRADELDLEDAPTDFPPPLTAEDATGQAVPAKAAVATGQAAPAEAPPGAPVLGAPQPTLEGFGLPPTLEAPPGADPVREDDPTTVHSTARPWPSPEPLADEGASEGPAPKRSRLLLAITGVLGLAVVVMGAGVVYMLTREEPAPALTAAAPQASPNEAPRGGGAPSAAAAPTPTSAASAANEAESDAVAAEVEAVEAEANAEAAEAEAAQADSDAEAADTEAVEAEANAEVAEAEAAQAEVADVIDDDLRRLAQRDPDTAAERAARQAQYAIQRGELAEARQLIDFALDADHTSHYAWAAEARYALAQNQPSEALTWARKASRRRPRRSDYHVLIGDALAASGDHDGARDEYRRALQLDPHDSDARSRLHD